MWLLTPHISTSGRHSPPQSRRSQPGRNAATLTLPRSGYRRSDLVHWHSFTVPAGARRVSVDEGGPAAATGGTTHIRTEGIGTLSPFDALQRLRQVSEGLLPYRRRRRHASSWHEPEGSRRRNTRDSYLAFNAIGRLRTLQLGLSLTPRRHGLLKTFAAQKHCTFLGQRVLSSPVKQ